VFLLSSAIPYTSLIQQPMHTTAVLGRHPHTRYAAPFDRKAEPYRQFVSRGYNHGVAAPAS